MNRIVALSILSLAMMLAPVSGRAQVGVTTDIVMGTVTGPDGAPLAGVTVEVMSVEMQITRRGRTNAQGRFTVLFPDGGGQYVVTFRLLGFAPAQAQIQRLADEDRLVANARLSQTARQIEGVVVRAQRPRRDAPERPTPGSTERLLTPEQITRLPIDAADLNTLATLAPGVVAIGGTDSTGPSFSVAGLGPTANAVTLDGLTFGASNVPQEAIRSTRVVTSTYDVARGQFSGGLIASTSRGGTNMTQGAFSYSLRDDRLAWEAGDSDPPLARGYTQNQLSGGLGGPIVRDKLFVFGSVQVRRRNDAVYSLLSADGRALSDLGASRDSVARFLSIIGDVGLPVSVAADLDSRVGDNAVAMARLDWILADAHSLTLRGDFRGTSQAPARVSPLALPHTGASASGGGGGLMANLSSNFGGRFVNELRAYASADRNDAEGYLALPAGRVQVGSDLGDSTRSVTTFTFGGNAGTPSTRETASLEVSNELSWMPGSAAHRIKFGGLLSVSRSEQDATANQHGTFTFNSLADLEAGRPASYTRTLTSARREGTGVNGAVYLGDTWRGSRALQVTYGARLESSRFVGAPADNPAVEQAFGYENDRLPTEIRVSPRVGFTLAIGAGGDATGAMPGLGRGIGPGMGPGGPPAGPPAGMDPPGAGGPPALFGGAEQPNPWIIRGGIGEFRSPMQSSLLSAVQRATGLSTSESQLVCIGDAAPSPDWGAYVADPSTIPSSCAAGNSTPLPSTAQPNVTLFEPDFTAPRSWRASLGVQRRIFGRFTASVEASWARGVSQTGFRDLNLRTTPEFTLSEEAERPVFVPVGTIAPSTGAVSVAASRQDPSFGQVLAINSDHASHSRQLSATLSGFTRSGVVLNLSYALAASRDQGGSSPGGALMSFTGPGALGGGFGATTTAGDPNVREWGPSYFDRRHSFTSTVTYPFNQSWEITAIGRVSSGAPFTPLVASDINGDGARNDRAFIFSPGAAEDTAVAAGMQRLLDAASARVADCLRDQEGRIAARNSCRGPWESSLELQVNWRPNALGLHRRLAASLTTVNLLSGVDQLLHGSANARGWGSWRMSDASLLFVRGFDPTTRRYQYVVNERFGQARTGSGGALTPFQLGIQLRYTVGPDPSRQFMRNVLSQRGSGGESGFSDRFRRVLPNPITQILGAADSLNLALTAEQRIGLRSLGDSLDATVNRLAAELQKDFERAGPNPDPMQLVTAMRAKLEVGRRESERSLAAARAILTAEQWAKVPESLKRGGALPAGR